MIARLATVVTQVRIRLRLDYVTRKACQLRLAARVRPRTIRRAGSTPRGRTRNYPGLRQALRSQQVRGQVVIACACGWSRTTISHSMRLFASPTGSGTMPVRLLSRLLQRKRNFCHRSHEKNVLCGGGPDARVAKARSDIARRKVQRPTRR